ncbi:MAG: response regulator transcription factor [Verrucomicrobia bacterium]|nr:response regulator transcription factor [Verrucomicrobiota bacterium]
MKVLIVDDSTLIRAHLIELLSEVERVEIVGLARDPNEALALFEANRPDAVILDIQMPGGSGIKVLERIKCEAQSCAVIMLTNHSEAVYRQHCLKKGADYFFQKATEFQKVAETLRELVHRCKPGKPILKRRTPHEKDCFTARPCRI